MKLFNKIKQGSKSGMTYVELLVAFSLLVVIISVFTPMLLSSYENIYKAGETVQNAYNVKTSVEEELATRGSVDVIYNLGVRLENIADATKLSFRRAIGQVRDSMGMVMESLFYGGNGNIRIISQKRVNDDQNYQDIVIKATGFTINDVNVNGEPSKTIVKDGNGKFKGFKYSVGVAIYLPIRSSSNSTEEEVYNAPLTLTNNAYGKSVQLVKYKEVIGEGGNKTYVESNESGAISAVDGKITLRVKGVDLTDSPVKIVVTYYDENTDMNDDGVTVSSGQTPRHATTFVYIDPPTLVLGGTTDSLTSYYTSAGIVNSNNTDGTVSSSMKVQARKMTGLTVPKTGSTVFKSINWIKNDETSGYGNYYVLTGTNGVILRLYAPNTSSGADTAKDVTGNSLSSFKIKDSGMNRMVYPVYWGGDSSHKFVYATNDKHTDYGASGTDREDDQCWRTEDGADTGIGQAGVYGTQAKFSYYYNAMRTSFKYLSQRRRNISYVLNEWGCALRFVARKRYSGDISGYQTMWNTNSYDGYKGGWENVIYTYAGLFDGKLADEYNDLAIATVSIRSLNTGSLKETLNYSGTTTNYVDYSNDTQLTVEDAVYLPSLGKMFYVGSAAANSLVTQLDNSRKPGTQSYAATYKDGWAAWGDQTMYCVIGNENNTGTTIYKAYDADGTSGYDDDKSSIAQTSSIVQNASGTSYFLKAYDNSGTTEYKDYWFAEHEVDHITDLPHTASTTNGLNHTAVSCTHTSTYIWDKDWRALKGIPGHTNRCDAGECAVPYCGREHYRDYWLNSAENRSTCSANFDKAAIHIPFDCWCNSGVSGHTYDHINPDTQQPVDDIGRMFVRCKCGQYHNPTENEIRNNNPGWTGLSYEDWFYSFSKSLNFNDASADTVGHAGVCFCPYCYSSTHMYVCHEPYEVSKDPAFESNPYDPTYDITINPTSTFDDYSSQPDYYINTVKARNSLNLNYCSRCYTLFGVFVQHTAAEADEYNYLKCEYSHVKCDGCGDYGEGVICGLRHRNYDSDCKALNEKEHYSTFTSAGRAYYNYGVMNQSTNVIDTTSTASKSFFVGRNFNNAFFSDVKFSLGYSSNREYVYSNFCYDGKTEQYKSYEKYYFLSHYGSSIHTPNYTLYNMTADTTPGTAQSHSLWNSINNDYYNVWFPGECYNLTTTASKEGVTIAVGYSVSGSTYQYINSPSNANSSTALGGIFNDGVLAICIDGQKSLENLLYFKDNATMDSTYLSTTDSDTYCKNASIENGSTYGHFTTYGTHARRSVQFTAVDIATQTLGTTSNATRNYYAYYGDNTGRVFKSLVATQAGSISETADEDGNKSLSFSSDNSPVMVSYIADTTFAGVTAPPSRMEEVKVDGASISTIFSEITNIVADDSSVIISGNSDDGTYVVVGTKALKDDGTRDDNNWNWVKVTLSSKVGNTVYNINDSVIVDGNYYAVGDYNSGKKGFLIGVSLQNLISYVDTVSAKALDAAASQKFKDSVHIDTDIDKPLYSIGGRGANG